MATYSYKRLGATTSSNGSYETLFQVPSSHEYIIDKSGITITNLDSTYVVTIRLARVDSGTTVANEDAILYDYSLGPLATLEGILPGACFAATDSVVVYADDSSGTAVVAFSASGLDIDNS